MTAGRGARTGRAAVFAAVCVVLAALGHVMMSGDDVPLWTLAAGWAVTGVVGWGLAGRERGPVPVTAVAVAAQTVLHSVFSLASPAVHHPMDPGAMQHGPHTMPMAPVTGAGTVGHPQHPSGDSSVGMLAAHLLAALLCGLWLGHGERAVFRLLRAVGGRLAAPVRLLFLTPVPPHRPVLRVRRRHRSDRAPRLLCLVYAITSRGPPAGAAAV
ncbi:hypothetical protein [Streptomyces capillispiralis]|uniref:Integral membrane protein n=1 Tax=Streptomyces capillispiralis TaxID=68182 RepID=A0A561T8P5_9ACTN|nr:hypothetical protein [Streptomyces capillispiralis]TWF83488.1 hypothetical protein FHX78_11413 [Streptomyces capillispiralis]